jgi:hypothetical protein
MSELLAYDADGNVVAWLSHMVARDETGKVIGLVDFAAHEAAGGNHTDIWRFDSGDPARPVKGSKVWPEWLGAGACDFRVELAGKAGKKRIAALVRKPTPAGARDAGGRFRPVTAGGHRRERAAIEAAIGAAIEQAAGAAADIRHIVGGPQRPLTLDKDGRTAKRPSMGTPAHLPLI